MPIFTWLWILIIIIHNISFEWNITISYKNRFSKKRKKNYNIGCCYFKFILYIISQRIFIILYSINYRCVIRVKEKCTDSFFLSLSSSFIRLSLRLAPNSLPFFPTIYRRCTKYTLSKIVHSSSPSPFPLKSSPGSVNFFLFGRAPCTKHPVHPDLTWHSSKEMT